MRPSAGIAHGCLKELEFFEAIPNYTELYRISHTFPEPDQNQSELQQFGPNFV